MIATARYVMMEASNDSSGSIVPYRVWLMRFGVPWLASGAVSQDVVVAVVVAYSLVVVGVKESLVGIAVFGYSYRSGMPRGSAAFGPSCMFSRLCMLNLLLLLCLRQEHRWLEHVLVLQPQVTSSMQAVGTGGSVMSCGRRGNPVLSTFQPQSSGCGISGFGSSALYQINAW